MFRRLGKADRLKRLVRGATAATGAGLLVLSVAVGIASPAAAAEAPTPVPSGEVTYVAGTNKGNPAAVTLAKKLKAKGGGTIVETYVVAYQRVATTKKTSTVATE